MSDALHVYSQSLSRNVMVLFNDNEFIVDRVILALVSFL